jgi:hypothetical protein
VATSAAHHLTAPRRGTSTNMTGAACSRRVLRRHSYNWCVSTPASNANALALKPDAAHRASSRLLLSAEINCRPRTTINALSSFIRRTLHGRRFADYAVAGYSLTLNRLSADRVALLDKLGFDWFVHSAESVRSGASWDTMYARLGEYLSSAGDHEGRQHSPSIELSRWMQTQRQFRKSGRLSAEREEKLNSIHFEWDPFGTRWQQMLDALRQYRNEHGDCRVPGVWPTNRRLANWVEVQRTQKNQGKLSAARIKALESLGFEWGVPAQPRRADSDSWAEMVAALKEYKDRHGDCRVPQRWMGNRQLADWVARQRADRKQRRISPEREQALDSLGFDWDPIVSRWETMFEQLLEYKKKHGNTNVRGHDREYARLANWIKMQRRDKKLGRPIGATRLHRLDEIGFVWQFVEPTNWEKMFEILVEFKNRHWACLEKMDTNSGGFDV